MTDDSGFYNDTHPTPSRGVVHPSVVDLRPCKALVMRRLPPGHAVREALLAEPDELPWQEASVKLQTYGVMLVRQGVSP